MKKRDFIKSGIGLGILTSTNAMALTLTPEGQFIQTMQAIEKESGGIIGVAVYDYETKRTFEYNGNGRFAMCSTFKMMLSANVLKLSETRRLDLNKKVKIKKSDMIHHSPITEKHINGEMTIAELCHATVTTSDNAAANLLIDEIGGTSGFNMFARSIGDNFTRLDNKEPEMNRFDINSPSDTTTPMAMMKNIKALCVGNALKPNSKKQLNAWLLANTTGDESLKKYIPKNWKMGDKTGSDGKGTVNDIGIIHRPNRPPICVAAYVRDSKYPFPENKKSLSEIGKFIATTFK